MLIFRGECDYSTLVGEGIRTSRKTGKRIHSISRTHHHSSRNTTILTVGISKTICWIGLKIPKKAHAFQRANLSKRPSCLRQRKRGRTVAKSTFLLGNGGITKDFNQASSSGICRERGLNHDCITSYSITQNADYECSTRNSYFRLFLGNSLDPPRPLSGVIYF
jgi:hypothetical protein